MAVIVSVTVLALSLAGLRLWWTDSYAVRRRLAANDARMRDLQSKLLRLRQIAAAGEAWQRAGGAGPLTAAALGVGEEDARWLELRLDRPFVAEDGRRFVVVERPDRRYYRGLHGVTAEWELADLFFYSWDDARRQLLEPAPPARPPAPAGRTPPPARQPSRRAAPHSGHLSGVARRS